MNPCDFDNAPAYVHNQKTVNFSPESAQFCADNPEDILVQYVCNTTENCDFFGCGYNGYACSEKAFSIIKKDWANSTIFGSILLGALCAIFAIWFANAVKIMVKDYYDNRNDRGDCRLSLRENNPGLERKRKK